MGDFVGGREAWILHHAGTHASLASSRLKGVVLLTCMLPTLSDVTMDGCSIFHHSRSEAVSTGQEASLAGRGCRKVHRVSGRSSRQLFGYTDTIPGAQRGKDMPPSV